MRRVFGPRTVVEAAFLVAVPVVALLVGLGAAEIIAASALGYLLVLVLEATLWREGPPLFLRLRSARAARATASTPAPAPELEAVVAREAAAEPEPEPEVVEPEPAADEPVPAPVPEPVAQPRRAPEHVRVLRPEREPEPEPEPVAVERPPLVAVPEPELEVVEPEVVEPVPAAPTVVPIGVGAGARQWNLWDLERLTREGAGANAARDEERTFLLMYLREFADPDGLLPLDFDGLVRDSFGELVGAR
jgi:hypothetical protein